MPVLLKPIKDIYLCFNACFVSGLANLKGLHPKNLTLLITILAVTLLANQKFKQSLMSDWQWQEWGQPSAWTDQQWWQWSSWTHPPHTGKRWHANPHNAREVQLRRHIDQKWEREKRRRQKKRQEKTEAVAAEQQWQEAEEWAREETEAFEARAKAQKESETKNASASEQKKDDAPKRLC